MWGRVHVALCKDFWNGLIHKYPCWDLFLHVQFSKASHLPSNNYAEVFNYTPSISLTKNVWLLYN